MRSEKSFHPLPPLKRFKLLHQKTPQSTDPFTLPAKKRIHLSTVPPCLPAKKRIWAPHPLLDLLPSNQSPEKKKLVPLPDLNEPTKEEALNDEKKHATEIGNAEEDGIICFICNSTDGDPSDPIVFCDGCDLTVHATCYGDPLVRAVPEGDWFCCKCELGGQKQSSDANCCLCPLRGGATKPTVDGRWAHVMCAFLVPEVFFRNPEGREGIDFSRVPQRRWDGVCYVCDSRNGCTIECSELKCGLEFHVGCGLKEDLSIEYREGKGGAIVAGFCKTHTLLWKKQQETGKFKIVAREQKRNGKTPA